MMTYVVETTPENDYWAMKHELMAMEVARILSSSRPSNSTNIASVNSSYVSAWLRPEPRRHSGERMRVSRSLSALSGLVSSPFIRSFLKKSVIASKSLIPNPLFVYSLLRLCFSTPQTTATDDGTTPRWFFSSPSPLAASMPNALRPQRHSGQADKQSLPRAVTPSGLLPR
nr:hypothetical protein Iba_chr04dCG11620 [Ipomoea batatas]